MRPRRRDLLRAGAGLATAAVGGLAGCLGSLPVGGGDGGGPAYARWLPARSALGDPPDARYRFLTLDVARLRDVRGRLSAETYRATTALFRGAGNVFPDPSAADSLVSVTTGTSGTVVALEGSFAASDLVGGVEDQGFGRTGSHAGYDLYSSERGGAIALADGTLVARGAREDAVAEIRRAIDVGEGDAERLAAASEDADALVAELGEGLFANGTVPGGGVPASLRPDALAANGIRGRVDGGTTGVRQVLVYEGTEAAEAGPARTPAGTAGRLDGVSVERSGRTTLVEGSVPTAELTRRDLFGITMGRRDGA